MVLRCSGWALVVASVAAVTPRLVHAQVAPGESVVVRVDGRNLVADTRDLPGGAVYRIYRPITVRHPITGRPLRDRYQIGTVIVTTSGGALSVVRAQGDLSSEARVGDIVAPPPGDASEVPRAQRAPARPPVEPWPSQPGRRAQRPDRPGRTPQGTLLTEPDLAAQTPEATPEAPTPPVAPARPAVVMPGASPEERAAIGAWLATMGRPPQARIGLYEAYLREHPNSPFVAFVRQEIATLTSTAAPSAALAGTAAVCEPGRETPSRAPTPTGTPAGRLHAGDPAVIALQLDQTSPFRAGVLHVRRHGGESYQSIPLASQGDGYLRARVPTGLVVAPGYDYFVEVVGGDGRSVPVMGSAVDPREVEVDAPPGPRPRIEGRSRMDLRAEFNDLGTQNGPGPVLNPGNPAMRGPDFRHQEYFTLVEGDFFQRFHMGFLYGYRVGFGVYSGRGQSLAAFDRGEDTILSTVVYGYHELEFAPSDFVHLMGRAQVGVHGNGLVGGFQARLRVGNERGTNIVVAGDVFAEVGQRAYFAFNFFPKPKIPMTAQGEVFNQTIHGGDPMFRFIAQAGYRVLPWATISLRASYQLRNIAHGGFGGGLSTTFDW